MKLDISKICDKKTVTRDDGKKINEILTAEWEKQKEFTIDFDNILIASVSFMDEAFGSLALKYSKEELQKKLRIEHILPYDKALLNDILVSRFRQKSHQSKQKNV